MSSGAGERKDHLEAQTRFAMMPTWVLDSGVSPGALHLYMVLWTYADAHHTCFPTRKTLAERLGVSMRTVDRARDELVAAGAITVKRRLDERGDYTSSLYVLRVTPVTRDQGSCHQRHEGKDTGDLRVRSGMTTELEPPELLPAPTEQAGGDRSPVQADHPATAKSITDDWWEWRERVTGVKPVQPWPAVRGIVLKALRAGHDDRRVRNALAAVTGDGSAVTINSLSRALTGGAPTSNGHRPFVNPPESAYTGSL